MSTVARRPPRSVALVNGAVVGVILVVVVALGVTVNQSAPPPIAAFAPQVQQQKHTQQSNQPGVEQLGAAAPAGARATPTPTPTATPTPTPTAAATGAGVGATPTPAPTPTPGRPVQLRCYGSAAPRQTADPKSPPCVQSFTGDNGGSTAPGVTGNTIYVAWPNLGGFLAVEDEAATLSLADYVNAHFQMYGRKIRLVKSQVTGGSFASNSAQTMQQDADFAARQANPGTGVFAALSYAPNGGVAYFYNERLAQDHVISINSVPLLRTDAQIASSTFTWTTMPGYDRVEQNLGDLVCNQLRGHPPAYAGTPPPGQVSFGARQFAVITEATTDGVAVDAAPLRAVLDGCGATPAYTQSLSDDNASNTSAVNAMEGAKVTSVICLCSPIQDKDLMNAAANQGYFPEWLVQNEEFQPLDSSGQNYPTQQQQHVIGIDFNDEFLQPQNSFWYQAIKEENPSYAYAQNGQNVYDYYRYQELLLLASGIQQAGPHLTPQTFTDGLYATAWSNAGAGAAPYWQASVAMSPSSHSWLQDAAAVWFNPSAPSYTTNQGQVGAFCYSRLGQRSADWRGSPAPVFYGGQQCRGG